MTPPRSTPRGVVVVLWATLLLSTGHAFVPHPTKFTTKINHPHRPSRIIRTAIRDATFGMGCFWKPSEELLKVEGVVDTVVGYTGHPDATKIPPTYDDVCFGRQWVEAVRVRYDDDKLPYDQLLDAFFDAQEPRPGSRQYASVIFVETSNSEGQQRKEKAEQWLRDNRDRRRKDGITAGWTVLEPLAPFYKAEKYHQEYWQKTRPRIAAMVGLLAISTGIVDNYTPIDMKNLVHDAANIAVLLGLAYVLIERKFDTYTEELL